MFDCENSSNHNFIKICKNSQTVNRKADDNVALKGILNEFNALGQFSI